LENNCDALLSMDTLFFALESTDYSFIKPYESSAHTTGYKIEWELSVEQMFVEERVRVKVECYFDNDQLIKLCVNYGDEVYTFEFLPNYMMNYIHIGRPTMMFDKCLFEHNLYKFKEFDSNTLYDMLIKSSNIKQYLQNMSKEDGLKLCFRTKPDIKFRYQHQIKTLNDILKSVQILVQLASCYYLSNIKHQSLQLDKVWDGYKMLNYDLTPK